VIGGKSRRLPTVLRWSIAFTAFLCFSAAAYAQSDIRQAFIFSPPNPQPGDNVSVFIRAIDFVNGYVLCPETGQVITRVSVDGSAITLDLSNIAIPGGFVRPYCDGNTVSLGVLPAGYYSVIARIVHTDGRVLGTPLLTGMLAVGVAPIPLLGPFGLAACAVMVGWFGYRFQRRPPAVEGKSDRGDRA
jgi:hypothetical protein